LDRYTQLKETSVIIPAEGDDNSSGDDEEEDDDDESEDDTGDEAAASDDITETHTGEVVGDNVTEDDGAEVEAKLAEKTQAEMVRLNNMRRLFVDPFHLSGCASFKSQRLHGCDKRWHAICGRRHQHSVTWRNFVGILRSFS